MSNPVEGLEPAHIWRYFAQISQIPRASVWGPSGPAICEMPFP